MERSILLQLFSSYAIPKSRRDTGLIETNEIEMKSADRSNHEQYTNLNNKKRPRHALITAPSVETVTKACKRIRLVNSNGIQSTSSIDNNPVAINSQKRQKDSQLVSFRWFENKEGWLIEFFIFCSPGLCDV